MMSTPGEFLSKYPEYSTTSQLDQLRTKEYSYLDELDHVYLDYTGSGLAATSQHRAHVARMTGACFGNPHSANPTSVASTELVEKARARILSHLNASPSEYTVVFTANATGACRLVGEAYPFDRRSRLVLTYDNHNSVNGIREFAKARGAKTTYIPLQRPELRISEEVVIDALGRSATGRARRGLFAYPAQSNFTGVQHPLDWISLAQERGYSVLLDAAAYLPTNTLDLSVVHPDFVAVSWYKVFGYPTGVGCLIVRRDALARLRRPWFSGGTIQAVSVRDDWFSMATDESAFEDGTLNFLSIPDVEFGLSWFEDIGADLIGRRVRCLTGWLLDRLGSLRHDNGAPLVRIYGPRGTANRGGTVAFNFLDPRSAIVDDKLVERESAAANFSLRTGCFCNPGASESVFGISPSRRYGLTNRRTRTIDHNAARLGLPSGRAIRVSLGMVSTIDDVERFLRFADHTYRNRRAGTP